MVTIPGISDADKVIPVGTYLGRYNGLRTIEYEKDGEKTGAYIMEFVITEDGEWQGERLSMFFQNNRQGLKFLKQTIEGCGGEIDGDDVNDTDMKEEEYLLTTSTFTKSSGEVVASIKKVTLVE